MIASPYIRYLATLVFLLSAGAAYAQGNVDFGDDSGDWTNDGECDDPRFEGDGMASILLDEDRFRDASDCRELFDNGSISLRADVSSFTASDGVNYGDDSSAWAFDGECDDPRFEGDGVASVLLDEDAYADATDCSGLVAQGRIRLRADAGGGGVDFGDDSSTWANDGECDDPRFAGEGMASYLVDSDLYRDATDCRDLFNRGQITLVANAVEDDVERNRLEPGDDTLSSGEYRDDFTFEGQNGQQAIIDLRSTDFDPYLIVTAPGGEQFDNDDYEGDIARSLLALDLSESGTYEVIVTSYAEGETGAYTLQMDVGDAAAVERARRETGTLAAGDTVLDGGEYLDTYEFDARPGQRVTIDLSSNDFDTYLILADPVGGREENDDGSESTDSTLAIDITESGTYRVGVTSYEAGETGSYELNIELADLAGGQSQDNRDVATLTVGGPARGSLELSDLAGGQSQDSRDVATLTVGGPARGSLELGDQQLETGEYQDIYVFDGSSGQSVTIDMTSSDFDTYVALMTPSGDVIENDDYEGSTSRSLVELSLTETGRYRVVATSYAVDEVGDYLLSLGIGGGSSTAQASRGNAAGGRTYGIFAGISDYPGTGSDLDFTAEDAIRVRDAMIRGGGMLPEDAITLTDSQATAQNLREALDHVASEAGPDDTFVFFYSGHGGRLERAGPEMSDPDSLDETLVLYDEELRDDEIREMFDGISAGTTLMFLDSCFSGGFAKDLISVPGRMGMFSSEEDVTSQVAVKFRAGGYLSYFLDEAIGEGYADGDRDGDVTAIELSEYVHLRYRNDVKSADPSEFVRTGGPQSGYQHLVVDRGSVGPYDVLFTQY